VFGWGLFFLLGRGGGGGGGGGVAGSAGWWQWELRPILTVLTGPGVAAAAPEHALLIVA
jgi:hypothetical protein